MSLRRTTNANRRGPATGPRGLTLAFGIDLTSQVAAEETSGLTVTGSPFAGGGYEASSGNYALLTSADAIARVPRTWFFHCDAPTAGSTRALIKALSTEWSLGWSSAGSLYFVDGSGSVVVSGAHSVDERSVIALSYDSTDSGSGTATIYANGEQVAQGTAGGGWGNPAYTQLVLGALNTVGGQLWDAKQYGVRCYDGVLSQEQVRTISAAMLTPVYDLDLSSSAAASATATVTGSPSFGPYVASSGNYVSTTDAAALARVPRTWLFKCRGPSDTTTRALIKAAAAEWSLGQTTGGLYMVDGSGGIAVQSTTTLTASQSYVVGLSYNATDAGSGTARIYVDGSEVKNGTAGNGWGDPSAGTSLIFGSLNAVGGQVWDGGIDRVRCYDGVLPAAMVSALGALM